MQPYLAVRVTGDDKGQNFMIATFHAGGGPAPGTWTYELRQTAHMKQSASTMHMPIAFAIFITTGVFNDAFLLLLNCMVETY